MECCVQVARTVGVVLSCAWSTSSSSWHALPLWRLWIQLVLAILECPLLTGTNVPDAVISEVESRYVVQLLGIGIHYSFLRPCYNAFIPVQWQGHV